MERQRNVIAAHRIEFSPDRTDFFANAVSGTPDASTYVTTGTRRDA